MGKITEIFKKAAKSRVTAIVLTASATFGAMKALGNNTKQSEGNALTNLMNNPAIEQIIGKNPSINLQMSGANGSINARQDKFGGIYFTTEQKNGDTIEGCHRFGSTLFRIMDKDGNLKGIATGNDSGWTMQDTRSGTMFSSDDDGNVQQIDPKTMHLDVDHINSEIDAAQKGSNPNTILNQHGYEL